MHPKNLRSPFSLDFKVSSLAFAGVGALFVACAGTTDASIDETTDAVNAIEAGSPTNPVGSDAGKPLLADASKPDAVVPGVDAAPIPQPPVIIDPGIGSACLRNGTPQSPLSRAHVIGVYESAQGSHVAGSPAKPITVRVAAAASPATLVLSSFDPIEWKVQLDPGASVARVLVSSLEPGSTSVVGLPVGTPIEPLPEFTGMTGWEPKYTSSGDFAEAIGHIRDELGMFEQTFQGTYSGSSFTVPPPATVTHSHYDNTRPCAARCGGARATIGWEQNGPGAVATITGTTAVIDTSTWGAKIVGTSGPQCGKHYFEVEVTGDEATVGARLKDDPLSQIPFESTDRTVKVKDDRVGVALDLETGDISFVGGTNAKPGKLRLWSFSPVVPAVELPPSAAATVKLVTRPPFKYAVPAGFLADM